MNNDTIFALSSGFGKAGIAVIRISGGDLAEFFKETLFPLAGKWVPPNGSGTLENDSQTPLSCLAALPQSTLSPAKGIKSRHAYLINLRDDNGDLIDQCIAIYFQAPNSFTGEDIIEIHSHGAAAVIEKIFSHLRAHGMRMAEPGEFSRRAFYNDKMDLTEIDGLAALLDARTEKQRESALKSMTGGDSAVYEIWRAKMIEISAYAAAILDYPSDELPEDIGEKLFEHTRNLQDEITAALNGYAAVRAMRSGFNIVLTGKTNVGKSSLFNRLVGSARAIVSDIPGTTRDVVSADLDIDGYLVRLSDTAGIRESDDIIEKIGIERTQAEIKNADLVIKVEIGKSKIESEKANEIIVVNKSDIINKSEIRTEGVEANQKSAIFVSALTGDGVPELLDIIKQKVHADLDSAESYIAVNERTRELLNIARTELKSAIDSQKSKIGDYDLFAEHVRAASYAIGKILGVICSDEIADAAASQLCLGK
ncbi:MAG: tRNA uridine-5-carboxymethylaminomethyl(34) synthesis GTPase MnmE [Rickettsiales bacterium]|nr:tRNA uridine-5-carboxymethylaminomethyl(34) synthesis GTPase MnmE [Rickettsiales bacterium]